MTGTVERAMDRAADRPTRREDVVTMALAGWTIVGLFVDAWKHSTDPGLETFWTPWHALFYSGFLATAGWLLLMAWRRRRPDGTLLDWAPRGHRLALIGVGLFAVGGAGDAVWHSVFGVETSLDALLSPTHLLLWLGLLAITSAPLRAAWSDRDHDDAATLRRFAPVLASLTITVTLVAFFLEYAWTPIDDGLPRTFYVPDGGDGELYAAFGVAGVLISTAVLMAPVLLASRRWRMPFGTVVLLFGIVNTLMVFGFDEDATAMAAILGAGLAADLAIRLRLPRLVLAGLPPLVLWAGYFYLVGRIEPGLRWPPEIWGGAIFFAVLVGLALEGALGLAVRDAARQRPLAPAREV